MAGTFEDKLCEYLKQSERSRLSLSLEQISAITKDLPSEAYSYNWWSNNPFKKQATGWLNAGYEVVAHDKIVANHIVCFRKYENKGFKKIIYSPQTVKCSKRIVNFLLITIVIGLFGKEVILPRVVESLGYFMDIPEEMELLRETYNAGNYEKANEYVRELRPKVENGLYRSVNKKRSSAQLAEIYSYDFAFTFDEYTNGLYSSFFDERENAEYTLYDYTVLFDEFPSGVNQLNRTQWKYLERMAKKGIACAEEAHNLYYKMLFYRYACELNLYQFSRTMDEQYARYIMGDSYSAFFDYYRAKGINPKDMGAIFTRSFRPISLKDLPQTIELHRVNLAAFQCCYQMVLSGAFSEDKIFNEMSWSNISSEFNSPSDNAFLERFTLIAECFDLAPMGGMLLILSNDDSDDETTAKVYSAALETIFMVSRYFSAAYLGEREQSMDQPLMDFLISRLPNLMEQGLEWVKSTHRYDILAKAYFEMSRLHFTAYQFTGNKTDYSQFQDSMNQWLSISNREDISPKEYDKYFNDVHSGDLLDLYISEIEKMANELDDPWNTDPLYYASICRELAAHYYYKAQDLEKDNSDASKIVNALQLASDYCEKAMLYFTETVNAPLNHSLSTLQDKIQSILSHKVVNL